MTTNTRSATYARRFLEPWNAHDVEAILRELPADFAWQFTTGTGPAGTTYRGREELRRALEQLFERIADLHYELVDVHAGDNHLVMELLVTGRNRETGEILNFQACDIVLFDGETLKEKRSYRKVMAPTASRA